jgi:hypothetical protein
MAENPLKVLSSIAKFYREALRRDKPGRELARMLGLHNDQVLERFQVGYANGSLLRAIPTKGDVRDALAQAGLVTPDGQEVFTGCLMVPATDQHQNVLGFVAFGSSGKEISLPGGIPLYRLNWQAFQQKEMIFTDSALKMLLFAQAGHSNAVPLSVLVTDEERAFLQRYRPTKAYMAGELPEAVAALQNLEVPCFRLDMKLPAAPVAVEAALNAAPPIGAKVGPDATASVKNDDIHFECGGRKYELRELAPGESDRLRVRLRAASADRFHLDTLDLYAGRSRTSFARAAAPLFAMSEAAIEGDLCLMIRKLEAIRAARKAEAAPQDGYAMTPDEEAEARELLKRPDILERVARDLEALGYVGENANKKIGYLITISRKLESPLSGVIISRAGAGKSRLMEALADLVPPEDLVSYTRITPQALYYAPNRSLKNKLMVAGEDEGLLGSDYAIRELISSKKIKLAAPMKDQVNGRMTTAEYEVEGPIALLFSTTQPAIHYENATRCFLLSLDESAEQTERVLNFQRRRKTLDGIMRAIEARSLRRVHQNAQRLLKPLLVVNPFAEGLRFSALKIESRREHDKYLSLIEAVAFLKQHQREVKRLPADGREVQYIEVTQEDIADADRLMTEAFGDQDKELSGPSRRLLELVRKLVDERSQALEIEPKAYQFNRREIREYTGWSDNQIKAHIKRLEEFEYLSVKAGDRGKMYRYALGRELETSGAPVGQKLGEAEAPASAGNRGTNDATRWEVGPISPNGQTAEKTEAISHV